ncbi:MAG: methylated-DNA--protein-cysteine methyltransferase [Hyphococcus sp.]|nr:MAG: methylated-DNA--protein-cysteine methyltransferase [Marinicaulis sp.]
MKTFAYHLFETALGRCAMAWGESGVLSVSFPEKDDATTVDRLARRPKYLGYEGDEEEASPPQGIVRLVKDITALFEGARPNFADARLDMEGIAAFDRELYALTLAIPAGELKTYGDLAKALGDVSLSRRVGQSLGRNPFPIIVPCHRVVGADGAMTGFSAPGGAEVKRRLLKIEGAIEPDLFD